MKNILGLQSGQKMQNVKYIYKLGIYFIMKYLSCLLYS